MAIRTTFIYTYTAFSLVTLAGCSASHKAEDQKPVTWTMTPVSAAAGAGESANVTVSATIAPGWHIYSVTQPPGGPIATRITIPEGQSFVAAGEPVPSASPQVSYDKEFKMDVQEHVKAVGFTIPVRLDGSARETADSLRVDVRYQVCNDSLCLPPQTRKLVAPVTAPIASAAR